MQAWIQEELAKYDLKTVYIDFSVHTLIDKNLKGEDLHRAVETIRTGRVVEDKSNKEKGTVGFRLYFGKSNVTYTVIAGLHGNFLRIVTLWKESGRV